MEKVLVYTSIYMDQNNTLLELEPSYFVPIVRVWDLDLGPQASQSQPSSLLNPNYLCCVA